MTEHWHSLCVFECAVAVLFFFVVLFFSFFSFENKAINKGLAEILIVHYPY